MGSNLSFLRPDPEDEARCAEIRSRYWAACRSKHRDELNKRIGLVSAGWRLGTYLEKVSFVYIPKLTKERFDDVVTALLRHPDSFASKLGKPVIKFSKEEIVVSCRAECDMGYFTLEAGYEPTYRNKPPSVDCLLGWFSEYSKNIINDITGASYAAVNLVTNWLPGDEGGWG